MKDSMLLDAKLPNRFWAEAMDTANYLRNRLPTHARTVTPEEAWTEQQPSLKHIQIFDSLLYVHIPAERRVKSDLNWTWKGIFVRYTNTSKQIKVWSTKTNSIHLISTYTIDETSRGVNLIETPLLMPTCTRLQDRKVPDAPHKCGHLHKLVVNTNINNIQHDCTNHNKDSNSSKEAEEDMPAPSLQKRGHPLNPLSTNSSERRLIETQPVGSPTSDSSTASGTIVVGGGRSLKVDAGVAETPDALDQSALMKPSIRARCNKQAMYEASTDGVVPLSERGVAETPRTEWMSVRLKEEAAANALRLI